MDPHFYKTRSWSKHEIMLGTTDSTEVYDNTEGNKYHFVYQFL